MSDNAPPPPEQPGFPPQPAPDTISLGAAGVGGPPDYLQPGPYYGDQPPAPKRRGPLLAVGIGTAMALIIGGGAYAFWQIDPLHFFRAGPQAAEAIPADALAYAAVDLDPAATQKINALRFLDHFPAFKDVADVKDERDDIRRTILTDAIDSLDCDGVSYDDTVEPWLGSKFGFAAMPSSDGGDPDALIAIEVTDQGAAADGLDAINNCSADSGEADDQFGYAFSGDYALLAETPELAKKFAADADTSSLADDSDFKSDMASLGDLGVATAWADIGGLIDQYPDEFDTELGGASDQATYDLLKAQYQRAAATFRFSSDHVDVVTSVRGDTPQADHGDNEIVNLPDSTVFAMSVAGGGDALAASWDDIIAAQRSVNDNLDQDLQEFQDETGLKVPDDLETLLGDNLMLAVDSDGLSSATLNSGDPSEINAGIRFTGDADKLNDLYDRVISLVRQSTGSGDLPFSKEEFDKGLAIAMNDDYAKKLADLDGNLGDSQNFQSVVDDAADQQFVMFFNWDLIEDEILDSMRSPSTGAFGQSMTKIADNLEPLRAFGITSGKDGDYLVTHVVVSVD